MNKEVFEYLEGKLNDNETFAFEQKMQQDEAFKKEVSICKNMNSLMEQEGEFEELRQRVIQTNKRFEKNSEQRKTKVLFLRWGSVAASVVVATGFSWYMVSESRTPQGIYATNFDAWNQKNITRGNLKNEDLIEWEELYSNQDYPLVIENYKYLDSGVKTSPQISLMLGCALMEQKHFNKALSVFDAIDTEEYFLFKADVNWFKGLCYLKINSIDKAKPFFDALDKDKKYGEKAQRILRKLD